MGDILIWGIHTAVIMLLIIIAYEDIRIRLVNPWMLVILLALWLITCVVEKRGASIVSDIFISGIILCILLLFTVVYEYVRGQYGFGGGDLKLYFVVFLLVGVDFALPVLLLSSMFGIIGARLWYQEEKTFPFAPSIVMATCLFLMVKWF